MGRMQASVESMLYFRDISRAEKLVHIGARRREPPKSHAGARRKRKNQPIGAENIIVISLTKDFYMHGPETLSDVAAECTDSLILRKILHLTSVGLFDMQWQNSYERVQK